MSDWWEVRVEVNVNTGDLDFILDALNAACESHAEKWTRSEATMLVTSTDDVLGGEA